MSLRSLPLAVPELRLKAGFSKVVLRLNNIWNPEKEAIFLRIFLNLPDADENTPTRQNRHFAGKGAIMARRRFPESQARGLLPWADPAFPDVEPDPSINLRFDVTESFRALAEATSQFTATVVLTNNANERLPDEMLEFDGVELRFVD